MVIPVTFRPGLAKLAATPVATGSPISVIMGMVRVTAVRASVISGAAVKIASGCLLTAVRAISR
jgi:hypothetical protein